MLEIINIQKDMFIISLYLGAGIGATYDFIRCIRRLISHNNIFIAIEDIIYWLIWAFVIIDKIHTYNYGSLRGYVFLGIFIGAVFYFCTISCVMMPLLSHILYHLKKYSKKINKMLKNALKRVKISLVLSKKSRNNSAHIKGAEATGYGYEEEFKKKKIN